VLFSFCSRVATASTVLTHSFQSRAPSTHTLFLVVAAILAHALGLGSGLLTVITAAAVCVPALASTHRSQFNVVEVQFDWRNWSLAACAGLVGPPPLASSAGFQQLLVLARV
jgi:hypothetical protein